ncbi:MAG: putative Ig domain-containing protein [Terriglobales bacterium]
MSARTLHPALFFKAYLPPKFSLKAPISLLLAALFLFVAPSPLHAQVAGANVNMVSGTQWPTGDPFLQRQNEPSMAVSTRNPLHILAGANDYRTVDLAQELTNETGDAWLGLFKSFDGGLTWQSTLLPGCPVPVAQCTGSLQALGYQAAADPVVRAGTNGMFYYAGLAFNRGTGGLSSVFVSRLMDLNNQENGDPISFIDTQIVATGNGTQFLDKPSMAVDIPRSGASTCSFTFPGPNNTTIHQSFAAGNIFVTYTDFLAATKENADPTHLMFTRSTNCGETWSTPIQLNKGTTTSQGSAIAINPINGKVYVAWRQFKSTGAPDAIMIAQSANAGKTFGTPVQISTFTPFDQGTSETSFRTNAYPSIAVDGFGIAYVAFSARGVGPAGDARIVVTGSLDGTHWIPPIPIDNPRQGSTNPSGRGHQIMPAISFANGRLTLLYYDLRLDHYVDFFNPSPSEPGVYIPTLTPEGELPSDPAAVFTQYVDDSGLTLRRHTIDLRVLELGLFPIPAFGPSVLVSQYAYGCCFDGSNIEQFKFNPPNLPLFGQGTEPFLGDYIDIVPSPQFVPSGKSWAYNLTPSSNPTFHAAWTDNRDVVPPADGNWENYTPPYSSSLGPQSLFDPSQSPPACKVGQEGMRNQNIYTAQITGGLIVGAPGNAKPLGTTTNPVTGQTVLFQRAFAVEAQNLTSVQKFFRFAIQNQPPGGKASFLQFSQLTTLDITVPALSSVSRSVFVTSTNAQATINVSVTEINQIGGSPVNNGLTASTILNPDITNPSITNPSITNPSITNPSITNSEVTNPSITNPSITNPSITNPSITNPDITNPSITNPSITNQSAANPSITNPSITNPDITNPSITNPSITNPDITNGSIADVSYPITNNGNTTSTYTVKLADTVVPPNGIVLQLIVNRPYQTPAANNCQLAAENHWVTVANIVDPALFSSSDPNLANPDITNSAPNEASITVAPGETDYITIRLVNPSPATIPFTANTLISTIFPATVPHAVDTQTVFQNGGNPTNPPLALLITTPSLPATTASTAYSQQLQSVGGITGAHTWTIVAGSLPGGLMLNSATGLISGTPTQAGSFSLTIQLQDSANPPDTTTANYTLVVNPPPAPVIGTTALPNGKYNSPYVPLSLSATDGTGPYKWSVGEGGVLPVGMALDPASGTFSGTPAQAGLWSIPFTVTDSNSQTASVNLALTVNLATAYAGAQNCYMPYPTTPMYYQGVSGSWSVITPASLNSGLTFVPINEVSNSNILAGCLSGTAISSGSYPLQFTVGDSAFSLPLPVVGQDTQDNGTYSVNSGSGANLPPSGYQQGVVTPSQAFNYLPGSYSADDNSTQNDQFLFGFSGSSPQVCGSFGGLSDGFTLTAPAQTGRFDILFDGSTQGCPQSAFPTTPAPIVIASVDSVSSTVSWGGAIISGVKLSSVNGTNALSPPGNVLEIESGGTSPNPVTVAFNYTIFNDPGCPGCIDQIEVGLNTEASPQACAYSGIPPLSPGVSGSAADCTASVSNKPITINVPNTPGRYYIGIDRSEDYGFLYSTPYWWSGPPPASRYIGVVDVWKTPPAP